MSDLGNWITGHYRELAGATSVRAVALRMRKQGWPLWVALLVLTGRGPR
jgi:hypothetical protein